MERYPHTLTVSWKTDTTFDGSGMPVEGTAVSHDIEGRGEANGKGNMIRTEDGMQIVYDWTYFCQRQEFEAPFNAEATLYEDGTAVWSGTIKRQANRQKGTEIWL